MKQAILRVFFGVLIGVTTGIVLSELDFSPYAIGLWQGTLGTMAQFIAGSIYEYQRGRQ